MLHNNHVIARLRANLHELELDRVTHVRIDDIARDGVDAQSIRKYARAIVHQRGWICRVRWERYEANVDLILDVFADEDAWQEWRDSRVVFVEVGWYKPFERELCGPDEVVGRRDLILNGEHEPRLLEALVTCGATLRVEDGVGAHFLNRKGTEIAVVDLGQCQLHEPSHKLAWELALLIDQGTSVPPNWMQACRPHLGH